MNFIHNIAIICATKFINFYTILSHLLVFKMNGC